MSDTPTVSVVMPAYNAERYLRDAVESILGQTWPHLEFLVFDDGSSDRTRPILKEYADKDERVRLYFEEHAGYLAWLNKGIAESRCDFIARMDADDISGPGRLARQLDYFQQHPDLVALGSWTELIDPEGESLGVQECPVDHADIDAWHLNGRGGGICHPAAMLRRSAVEQVGGYRPQFEYSEDYDLFLRLAEVGRLANIPEVLFRYRIHFSGVSHDHAVRQARLVKQARAEAYDRRGLEKDESLADDDRAPVSAAVGTSRHTFMARTALDHGNLQTAHKHAWLGVRRAPWSLWSWQVLIDVQDALARDPGQDGHPPPGRLSRFAARACCEILQAPRNVRRLVRWACSHTPGLWRLIHQR